MIENTDIEAYLFVSKIIMEFIYLIKKSNNLYKKETEFKNDNNNLDLNFQMNFLMIIFLKLKNKLVNL